MILAISSTIVGLPVAIPAVISQIAAYLAVAGTVMSGLSQATVDTGKLTS